MHKSLYLYVHTKCKLLFFFPARNSSPDAKVATRSFLRRRISKFTQKNIIIGVRPPEILDQSCQIERWELNAVHRINSVTFISVSQWHGIHARVIWLRNYMFTLKLYERKISWIKKNLFWEGGSKLFFLGFGFAKFSVCRMPSAKLKGYGSAGHCLFAEKKFPTNSVLSARNHKSSLAKFSFPTNSKMSAWNH